MKHAKTRTLVMTSGFLVLGACGMFYAITIFETMLGQEGAKEVFDFLRVTFGIDLRGLQNLKEFREVLWRSTFLLLMKAQLIWVLIVVARVGAGLISKDLKSRALPIYFSKPITPTTYLLGKWLVIVLFVGVVTVVPNLLSLLLGSALTGGLDDWKVMVHLGVGILLSGLAVCCVSGAVILALSSLSSDQRYVSVGWVALCVLSIFAQQIVLQALPPESLNGWLKAISLRDNIVIVFEQLLGVRESLGRTNLPANQFETALLRPMEFANVAVLIGLTLASVFVAWRRVVRFSRAAASVQ